MAECSHKNAKDFEISGEYCPDCGKFHSLFENDVDRWVEMPSRIQEIISEWQDENRTYLPAERQLDV